MSGYSDFYEAREKIVQIVSEDLLGPVSEDEVLNEPPTSYYIMGKLYPNTEQEAEQDDNTTSTDLDAIDADASLASANIKNPRAMGITYTVKKDTGDLCVNVNYAFYKPYSLEKAKEEAIPLDRYNELIEQADEKERARMFFWKRLSFHREVIILK